MTQFRVGSKMILGEDKLPYMILAYLEIDASEHVKAFLYCVGLDGQMCKFQVSNDNKINKL